MKDIVFIYAITVSGKIVYVGQTVDMIHRYNRHSRIVQTKVIPHSAKLYNVLISNPDSWDMHEIERTDRRNANAREVYWMRHLDTINNGCNTSDTGGREKGCLNPSGDNHYLHGKPVARHIVEASVAARKGKNLSEEHKEKIRKGNTGKQCNSFAKPVICLNDGKEFRTTREAAAYYNISSPSIKNICTGKTSGKMLGLKFKYKAEV